MDSSKLEDTVDFSPSGRERLKTLGKELAERRENILEEFYAVTETSVYRIRRTDEGAEAIKIARNAPSQLDVGEKFGDDFIGFCEGRICAYSIFGPALKYEKRIMTNACTVLRPESFSATFNGWTSGLVALFLEEGTVLECHDAENKEIMDTRWIDETISVFRAIGDNDDVFILSEEMAAKLREAVPSLGQ